MKHFLGALLILFALACPAVAQIGTSGTLSIPQDRVTGVAPGTYTCPTETIDATGRATAATNGTCSGGGGGSSFQPFCNVVSDEGAHGDGVTDDTAAINACILFISGKGGGVVYFPPTGATGGGTVYCVFSGLVAPSGIILRGASQYGTVLSACNHDVTVIALEGSYTRAENMTILGRGSATTDTFSFTKPAAAQINCGDCTFRDVVAKGGTNAIEIYCSGDANLEHVFASHSYGNAEIYTYCPTSATGGWWRRVNADQLWPNGCSYTNTNLSIPNWSANTAYGACSVVTLPSGFVVQILTVGTSGASAPAAQPYGAVIADGSAQWSLVRPTTYYGIQFDTGSVQFIVDQVDVSCACSVDVAETNSANGTPPGLIQFSQAASFSAGYYANVLLISGANTFISQATFGGCDAPNCAGLQINCTILPNNCTGSPQNGSFTSTVKISDSIFIDLPYAVLVYGASDITIANSTFGNIPSAAIVFEDIDHFTLSGNHCGGYSPYGAVHQCWNVSGSDYGIIMGNDTAESAVASTPTTFTHGQVFGNL